MRAALECVYRGRKIHIDEALEIRDRKKLPSEPKDVFLCVHCNEELRAHKCGGGIVAHFEHRRRNEFCPHSAASNAAYTGVGYETFDIDDPKAREGYELDRKLLSHARNARLAKECKKRDDYKCRACGFILRLNGSFIIECHHLNPISLDGERTTKLAELVSLCPTCHRIAHTRTKPLNLDEIKSARGI